MKNTPAFDRNDPPRLDRRARATALSEPSVREACAEAHPVLTGLALLWHDHWEAAHGIAQSDEGERDHDLLHYFVHRREGDFGNAGYWLRGAEHHPCFARLGERANERIGSDSRRDAILPNGAWSPRGFLDAVRRDAKKGGTDGDDLLRCLQAEEFIAYAEWLGGDPVTTTLRPVQRARLICGALLFAAASALCAAPAQPEPLRIATFNLKWLTESATETRMAPWRDEDDLAAHRAALADIVAEMRPDVLCVQEATTRAALEALAEEPALRPFGYRVLHIESGDTGTGQDVAFLVSPRVRLDTLGGAGVFIRRFADTLEGRPAGMPRRDPRRQRLTKHALICLEAPRVCLLGVHLLAHPDNRMRTAARETQALVAARIVRTEIVARGYAPVVLGDFNDFDIETGGPSSYAAKKRRVLTAVMDYDTVRPGPELFNVAHRIHPKSRRFSAFWDRNGNEVRDARDPHSLLDHILVDKSLESRVGAVTIRHDLQDGSVSDHWPVVVELSGKWEVGNGEWETMSKEQ